MADPSSGGSITGMQGVGIGKTWLFISRLLSAAGMYNCTAREDSTTNRDAPVVVVLTTEDDGAGTVVDVVDAEGGDSIVVGNAGVEF